MTLRLLYLVSHPIQYQAPLLRKIAAADDIDLTVSFATDSMTGTHWDPGFRDQIEWNVPLTEGYRWQVDKDAVQVERAINSNDVPGLRSACQQLLALLPAEGQEAVRSGFGSTVL